VLWFKRKKKDNDFDVVPLKQKDVTKIPVDGNVQ